MKTMLKAKIFLGIIGVATTLLSYSCYKDQGNYDYKAINEITIGGLPETKEILERETITIVPALTSTLAENENNYSYEWIAIRMNSSTTPGSKVLDTIARTRNLENFVVPLLPNEYEIHYRVTDKATNVYAEANFKLTVKTKIYEGFLVMNDIDGVMRLDMLSFRDSTFHFIKDVLTEVESELPPQQGPIKIAIFDDATRSPENLAIYLLTETDANRIDPETFHYDPIYNIRYHFLSGTYPAGFTPKNIKAGAAVLLYGEDAQGKGSIYNYVRTQNFSWSVKVNTLDYGVTFFDPSPVFAVAAGKGGVIFDNDTKSFYRISQNQDAMSRSTQLPEGLKTPFVNTKKDLLYMANIEQTAGLSYYKAVLDSVNTCRILSFNDDGTQDQYEQIMDPNMYQGEHFAIGGEFYDKYIFYSIGGKVYAYDIPNKISTLVLDKGSDNITVMEFHKFYSAHRFSNSFYYKKLRPKLIVCSYNNSSKEGKMELYTIPNTISGMLTATETYEGFGKIVSVHYRER